MIIIYHNQKKIVSVFDVKKKQEVGIPNPNISYTFFALANLNPNRIIAWCEFDNKPFFNIDYIYTECTKKNKMISFSENSFISSKIGYIDESPFLKVNKTVKYPTWLMSSLCGAINASVILTFKSILPKNQKFAITLNSMAKLGMPKGLLCYSAPKLLFEHAPVQIEKEIRTIKLFQFVAQHYKLTWSFLLFFNLLFFEKRFYFGSFISSLFKSRYVLNNEFETDLGVNITSEDVSYDVIIPTLGRKTYLYDVLLDLSKQTLLPSNVIIVEQNDCVNSKTELDYLINDSFPFKINHKFIQITGACNARNLALNEVISDYVFFADDDIRFDENTLSSCFNFLLKNSFSAITISCLENPENIKMQVPYQSPLFGSGCSIVNKSVLKGMSFNMAFEHGFGEDLNFGAELRHKGADIIYFSNVVLKHLKAPIGGFRTKFDHPWSNQEIEPKPSPTVLLYRILHNTKEQVLGYKVVLFIKYYKVQLIKNPFKYYKKFKKQWRSSLHWANLLRQKHST